MCRKHSEKYQGSSRCWGQGCWTQNNTKHHFLFFHFLNFYIDWSFCFSIILLLRSCIKDAKVLCKLESSIRRIPFNVLNRRFPIYLASSFHPQVSFLPLLQNGIQKPWGSVIELFGECQCMENTVQEDCIRIDCGQLSQLLTTVNTLCPRNIFRL